jgi:monoamine oxidase
MANEKLDCDVIVIGAGAAGMTAAGELMANGRRTLVLEANARPGGRIWTIHPTGVPSPIELGAEFIHGMPEEIWRIVEHERIRLCDISSARWQAAAGTFRQQGQFFPQLNEVMERLGEFSKTSRDDKSFAEFADDLLKKEPALADGIAISRRFVEGYNAARQDLISVKFLAAGDEAASKIHGDVQWRIIDGYDQVVSSLARKLGDRLRLGCPVHRIRWQPGSVEVTSGDQILRARQAIITVSLGVLKAAPGEKGAIEFVPDIPAKRAAADGIVLGSAKRATLVFQYNFWEETHRFDAGDEEWIELGFFFCPEAPIPTWWSQYPIRVPLLTGWAGGTKADALPNDADGMRRCALESLSVSFGLSVDELESLVTDFFYYDWGSDPYFRGAYSYEKVNGHQSTLALAAPIENTLFFAGEATETDGFSGTVHGAIRSGLRCAKEVLASRIPKP